MFKSYKYMIFPSDVQKKKLENFFGVARLIYNLGIEVKTYAYSAHKKGITKYDLIYQLPKLRKEFDWIKACPIQIQQQVIFNLDIAYQKFFKNKAQFPRFKNKFSKQSIVFTQGFKSNFDSNTICLCKLGNISVDYHRRFEGIVKRITLLKTTTNKYFVSILVKTGEQAIEKKTIQEETAVGVDFGIKYLAITSDSKIFENKHFFTSQQKRLRIEQRSLSRKQKDGNNYNKQKLIVALLHEKIRNQRTDYLQKISTYLICNYNTIVLEDLVVSDMIKNKYFSKAISEVAWRQLRTMLEYKAEWYGKNIITIGRFEPSSKTCSNCGNIKQDLKIHNRTYYCDKCGFELDRDKNAAINIKAFGLRNQSLLVNVMQ